MNIERLIVLCATFLGLLLIGSIGGCVVHESNRTLYESHIEYGLQGTKISESRKVTTYPIKKYLDEERARK